MINSVMLWPIHDHPSDYWRFTPEAFRSLLNPFTPSFVGFAGDELFPHTVVGIGFKDTTFQSSDFREQYSEWQKDYRIAVVGRDWYPKYLTFTNRSSDNALLKNSEAQLAEKEHVNQVLTSLLSGKEQELNEIYKSKAWRLLKFLRRLRPAIAPKYSRTKCSQAN